MKSLPLLRPAIALLLFLTAAAHANPVAYWRFEGANFVSDSVGSNVLTNHASVAQVASTFSDPVPRTGAANANAASFSGSNYLTTGINTAFLSNTFTVEAFFNASNLSGSTTTRMIAGVWATSTASNQSYLLGTRNGQLLLQLRSGSSLVQHFAFPLATGTDYYAAAAVDLSDTGPSAITLYLKDLSTGVLQEQSFTRELSSLNTGTEFFSIGATGTPSAHHVGTIDEVRYSSVKLSQEDLLISQPPTPPIADWEFEDEPGFLTDSSAADIDLTIAQPVVSQSEATHFLGKSAAISGGGFLAAADMPAWDASTMTAEVLFRAADVDGSTQVLVGRWHADDDQRAWALSIGNGQIRYLKSADGVATTTHDVLAVESGKDYHLAVVVNGPDGTVFLKDLIEDTPFATATLSGLATPPHASSAPLTIGATAGAASPFTGLIGRVRIHDVALTEGNLMLTPPPLPPPPPPPPTPGETPTWLEFRNSRFGGDIVAAANPFADPDGDGVINLFEHAFGGEPDVPATADLPIADFSAIPSELALHYPRYATDVDYIAEWSPDLTAGSWSPLGFGPETQDPVSEWYSRTLQHDPALPQSFVRMGVELHDPENLVAHPKADGFRGLWYELSSSNFTYGRKYSGGLGTYTANHVPMAIYAPEVNRTYLTWGGTTAPDEKNLLIKISYFDHNTGLVARPVVVMDKTPINDAHDNAALSIDEEGYLWVIVSGRSGVRPGRAYRSKVPYGINDWQHIDDWTFAYPQPWWFEGRGFLFTYTRYVSQRRFLYFQSSRNGTEWTSPQRIAGFGGHYQTSEQVGDRLVTAFNRHPSGVDSRTDIYYMETADMGETWTTADGAPLTLPLETADNPARIRNFSTNADSADNWLVYICDVVVDADGHPVILYITAKDHRPGPQSADRAWNIARWTGTEWLFHEITIALHNYDMGSIYVEEDGTYKVIAPIGAGPQEWGTGGEIEVWTSGNQGATWAKQRAVTADSPRNHSYARRPRNAHPEFYAYWADGHAHEFSESHLWFTNKEGDKLWHLPYDMTEDFAAPVLVDP